MWVTFATLAGVTLGCGDLALKMALPNLQPRIACFTLYFLGLILWIPIFLMLGLAPAALEAVHLSPAAHGMVIGRSLLQFGAYAPIFIVLRNLPLGTYAALRALSPALSVVAGTIFYGDRPNAPEYLGIGAILSGVVLVAWERKTAAHSSIVAPASDHLWLANMVLTIIAATCSGLMSIYDKHLLSTVPANLFVLQALSDAYRMGLLTLLLAFSTRPALARPLKWNWRRRDGGHLPLLYLGLASLLIAFGEIFSFYAVSFPDSMPSIVAILRRSSLPVSVILANLFFRERLTEKKMLGMASIMAGVALINAGWTSDLAPTPT
ncbi:transporter family protein [Neorhizobium galegae]|uniref:EamA family transporter n=1 Tax=Neorhizobium galegae TaxID=399 RepID=UPI001AEA5A72|nr:EamA family transporter [Neorhizobium galegae]MBP2561847.1 transporter family protein [Neorhizobium galegae]